MNTNPIFDGLNDKQLEAVQTTEGPVLVISGPGSGKTRCLTHRIAHLIATGVPANSMLALTFTNKAANEIKERVKSLIKTPSLPTLGTFHSIGLRILRREIEVLGYGTSFTILDSADQQALMKRILASLELDPKRHTPGSMLGKISKLKTELIAASEFSDNSFTGKILQRVYLAYQSEMTRMNAVDFGDLIMLPVRIFQRHPEILARYQQWWKYIMVDEYQDTSHDQYTLITMLAATHRNLFCIGDDAQSIYLFRQADIRNILNFQKDYPEGKIILLEQNYRSTKAILAAAQALIANNKHQIPKELWTDNGQGAPITITETVSERHEAQHIIETVRSLQRQRYVLSDIAILYRTHAQSRALEESLVRGGMPYRIVGGIRFYERKEIKDLMAYLRLLNNPSDTISFERIANVPLRGIGPATVERITAIGGNNMIASLAVAAENHAPTSKTGGTLRAFHALLTRLRATAAEVSVSKLINDVIRHTRYEDYLRTLKGEAYENAEERIENIAELLTVAKKYDEDGPLGLGRFLEEVALVQDADRLAEGERAVTLMTMHAAKGLEFPIVFIAGMEEGLFPHSRTIFVPHELEEERRLCYVAITRAKEQLHVTLCKWRTIYGSRQANIPSRFLNEIPDDLMAWHRLDLDTWSGDTTVTYDE
jgi:DNA helicase-2/ATP-dependent DNA helicase PcrA